MPVRHTTVGARAPFNEAGPVKGRKLVDIFVESIDQYPSMRPAL